MKDEEIERVFRAQKIPADIEKCPSENVVQGYLAIDEAGAEIRLRKKGDRYFQTFNDVHRVRSYDNPVELVACQARVVWSLPALRLKDNLRIRCIIIDCRGSMTCRIMKPWTPSHIVRSLPHQQQLNQQQA